MKPDGVAYVYDGDTFVGSFDISPQGNTTLVRVRYKDATASAQINGLDPETVARVLLGELVRDDIRGSNGQAARPPVGQPARRPFNSVPA